MSSRAFALLCLLVLFPALTRGQITIHVPADQPTIQAGINAANTGDTVLVAPGTYTENIDFKGKAIVVTSSGAAAQTTISGNAQSATVSFQSGETRSSVLSGFTITGGGGSMYGSEGGVYALHASPSILNNIITGAGCNGIASLAAAPLIQGNEITRTHVDPATMGACGDANGAGIWINGTDATLTPFPTSQGLSPEIVHNLIDFNTEAGTINGDTLGGAGIAVRAGALPKIGYNVIRRNSLNTGALSGGTGGGILVFAAGALIVNNLISGNTAIRGGGGISVWNYGTFSSQVMLINNTVANNDLQPLPDSLAALFFGGAQVYFSGSYQGFFLNNLISGMTQSASLTCSLTSSPNSGVPAPSLEFVGNDVFNGLGPVTDGAGSNACNYPVNSGGNLTLDPLLANSSSEDFRLDFGSPAIDAGSNTAVLTATADGVPLLTDLDGNPRVQNATGKSTAIIDIGAYEAAGITEPTQPTPPTPPAPPTQVATQTTLSVSPNPAYQGQTISIAIAVTASGGATVPGNVSVYDGSNLLGTPVLNASGQATLPVSTLAVGTHSLTAVFAASGNFLASTSTPVQEIVLASSFSLTLQPTALTLAAGGKAVAAVNLASIGNFAGPITLSTGAVPANLTASFAPGTVALTAGNTATASLQLTSIAVTARSTHHEPSGPASWPAVTYALALLPLARLRRRPRFQLLACLLATAALLTSTTGCNTIRVPLEETPVAVSTYQIPVTATDAKHNQQTATLTLTVTP